MRLEVHGFLITIGTPALLPVVVASIMTAQNKRRVGVAPELEGRVEIAPMIAELL
tara:strand:- start:4627 stop:4791 length:165 start_codon:yes stop_codon:yes gene_type:complete